MHELPLAFRLAGRDRQSSVTADEVSGTTDKVLAIAQRLSAAIESVVSVIDSI